MEFVKKIVSTLCYYILIHYRSHEFLHTFPSLERFTASDHLPDYQAKGVYISSMIIGSSGKELIMARKMSQTGRNKRRRKEHSPWAQRTSGALVLGVPSTSFSLSPSFTFVANPIQQGVGI